MQSLELNLSTRPFRNNTLIWLSMGLGLLLLGVLSMWNWRTYKEYEANYADLEQLFSDIRNESGELERRARQARSGIAKHDVALLKTQAEKADEFIRWKAFSWTRLFNQLQEVQPHNVQMISIRPVFHKNRRRGSSDTDDTEAVPVSVEGLARTLQDFFELERALVADPHFNRIEPEATDTDETTNETVFSLRFLYTPKLEEENALQASEETDDEAGEDQEEAPADPVTDGDESVAPGLHQARTDDVADGREG